jgi:hypothetical protein
VPPPVVPAWVAAATASVQQSPSKDYQIQLPSGQQVEAMAQQLLQSIVQGIMQVLDGYILPGVQPTEQLATWAATFNAIAADIEAFLSTGNWSDLTSAFTSFFQLVFGSNTAPSLFASIAAPVVTDTPASVQTVSNFPNAASIQAGGGWSWDPTVTYEGSAGSLKFVASGVLSPSMRGVMVPVQPGQLVSVPDAVVQWSGLSASGSPIQIQFVPYSAVSTPGAFGTVVTPGVAGAAVLLSEVTSPGSSSSWVGLTPVTGSGVSAGVYTVPSSGVGFVQIRLVVTAAATAGSVWWNACSDAISGGFLPTLASDFATLQSDFAANNAAFATFLQAALATIEAGGSFSTIVTALEAEWMTYTTTASGLLSSEIFTIQQLLSSLLDINTSTGLMSALNVSNVLGSSSLGADVQAILDNIANALGHSGTGHTLANIESYLGLIPPANVTNVLGGSNLGADVQAIVDKLSNGLGVSGTGHTLANLLSYIEAIPNTNVTNVLGGANLGADLTELGTALFGSPTVGAAVQYTALPQITIGGITDDIESHIQAAVDAVANTLGVATGSGNPISSINVGLAAIPSSNVVGNTGAAVTFGAAGAGAYSVVTGVSTDSISWSHTIATGDLGVIVASGFSIGTSSGSSYSSSMTYGGAAMSLLGTVETGGNTSNWCGVLQLWWLKSPPSGSKTVVFTATNTLGNPITSLFGESSSYAASSTGTAVTAFGSGSASLSVSASSATNHMVVGALLTQGNNVTGTETLSSFSQTSRYSHTGSTVGSGQFAVVMGDGAGASSVTLSATSSSTGGWAGIAVDLSN